MTATFFRTPNIIITSYLRYHYFYYYYSETWFDDWEKPTVKDFVLSSSWSPKQHVSLFSFA